MAGIASAATSIIVVLWLLEHGFLLLVLVAIFLLLQIFMVFM